ncbi:MAG: hypothetical protein LC641_11610 [Spirochaeta sp.]|nr:hypothetical protein [Spirochaeta sp.]
MRHPKLQEFDDKMKHLFDEVDAYLEDRFGDRYPLHPARAADGSTANPEQSGLFAVGADFTAGYGSELGRGYLVAVDIKTLTEVPDDVEEEIDQVAVEKVSELLPVYFPQRQLEVTRDRRQFKIHGDLGLGGS